MGERTDRVVAAVRHVFEDMSIHVREERVIDHLAHELEKGRDFDDILRDPFVQGCLAESDCERLLENPETLRQIERELAKERGRDLPPKPTGESSEA